MGCPSGHTLSKLFLFAFILHSWKRIVTFFGESEHKFISNAFPQEAEKAGAITMPTKTAELFILKKATTVF